MSQANSPMESMDTVRFSLLGSTVHQEVTRASLSKFSMITAIAARKILRCAQQESLLLTKLRSAVISTNFELVLVPKTRSAIRFP